MTSATPVSSKGIVKLAPMECMTSCLLSYLNRSGFDHRLLLLDYWNIGYQFRTLLSSKDIRQLIPEYFFGVSLKLNTDPERDFRDDVEAGKSVILICSVSKLPYFPKHSLNMETVGFQHGILVQVYDAAAGSFAIVDPMADHAGWLDEETLRMAARRNDKNLNMVHFTLENSASGDFRPPTPRALFARASERNLNFFHSNIDKTASPLEWFAGRHGGSKAFDGLARDLVASHSWTQGKVGDWVERNKLTIGSIMAIRQLVWEAFRNLGVMNEEQTEYANARVESIIKDWRTLVLRLMKWKVSTSKAALADPILFQIEKLKQQEADFLEGMAQIGRSLLHDQPQKPSVSKEALR